MARLTRLGLVRSVRRRADRRVKATGWRAAAICAGLDGPLLASLAAIEQALDEKPLRVRAARAGSDGDA